MALNIQIDQQKLAEFCAKWGIQELAIYDVRVREGEGEVTDVMYTPLPGVVSPSYLGGFFQMEDELSEIMGRTVALTDRKAVEHNNSREQLGKYLETAQVIYARRRTTPPHA